MDREKETEKKYGSEDAKTSEEPKPEDKFQHWDPDAGAEEGFYNTDMYTRNQRVFNTLLQMGLVVIPHIVDEGGGIIDYMYVSTGPFSLTPNPDS